MRSAYLTAEKLRVRSAYLTAEETRARAEPVRRNADVSPVCYLLASNFERMPAAALREFSIHPFVSFSIFVLPFLKVRIAESPPRWLDGFGSPCSGKCVLYQQLIRQESSEISEMRRGDQNQMRDRRGVNSRLSHFHAMLSDTDS